MTSNLQEMSKKAVEIRSNYSTNDPKQWNIDQVFMGLVKDIGDLSKILMNYEGYRKDLNEEVKTALEHELSDILYSILIIANKTDVDLEKSFWRTMKELDKRFKK